MRRNLLMTIILPYFVSCGANEHNVARIPSKDSFVSLNTLTSLKTIKEIPLPAKYNRVVYEKSSFSEWLRTIPVKSDNNVYLYNGQLKKNQSAQFAVLDIPIGNKDLQQCADAVMRLRAQYLYNQQRYKEISFSDNNGTKYTFPSGQPSFEKYLEKVFSYCGTLSLDKQLDKVGDYSYIEPGYVFIKGGSPGHAVIVVDVAINDHGNKIFLLAQSYMPAQDIHVLKNPTNRHLSPWYELNDNPLIHTPEWVFERGQLKKW